MVVTVGSKSKEAVKLVRVIDCVNGCKVSFIPRCWTELDKVQDDIIKVVLVNELYQESTSVCKRDKSAQNVGMCSIILLDTAGNE
jgi:hypothetical protein